MVGLYKKILYCITLLFLYSCADSTDTPPFNFHCMLKLENTNMIGKNSVDVFLSEPEYAEVVNVSFRYNEIDIQVQDENISLNKTIDYIIIVRFMQENILQSDTIRIKYHFSNGLPYINSAFYNDEKPIYMANDIVVFNLSN